MSMTKVQQVGSRMRSTGVVAAVEPWLLGISGGLATNASCAGAATVHGSVDSPCSASAFATRVFTWSSRLASRSLSCFLYMSLSSSHASFQITLFPRPLTRPMCSGFPKARVSSSLSLEGLNKPFYGSSAYFKIFDTACSVSNLVNLSALDASLFLERIQFLVRFDTPCKLYVLVEATSSSIFLNWSSLP